ncbi:hypothetical protein BMETH_1482_0 [methanotrophic bacterial endosymbiont of Bathymodiolus sp.]|nr:hypothetical protein BMETH_1482_0 [methanotrophic bacterial endosymbiont of Bathymodiolus sp.]
MLRGSNPRPSPCKGDALPAELSTRLKNDYYNSFLQSCKLYFTSTALLYIDAVF